LSSVCATPRLQHQAQFGLNVTVSVMLVGRYTLMQHCWHDNPDQRPSFSEIKTYLQGHLDVGSARRSNRTSSSPRSENSEAAANQPTGNP